jgi:hypothetical protein
MSDQRPMYTWCDWCRRHVLTRQYTAHAAVRHPSAPAPQIPKIPPAAPATHPLTQETGQQ